MLIGIEGELGGGKTLLMVYYLLKEYHSGRSIHTNLWLKNIPYQEINILELLENNKELYNLVLGVDELTVYVDCRLSMTKANRFFSYLILQSRKRSVDIYYTTQNFSMIDKRVLEHTLIQVVAEKIYKKDGQLLEGFRHYTIYDFRNARKPRIKRFMLDIRPFYNEYDTDQIITPIYDYNKKTK